VESGVCLLTINPQATVLLQWEMPNYNAESVSSQTEGMTISFVDPSQLSSSTMIRTVSNFCEAFSCGQGVVVSCINQFMVYVMS
jgi:hypothetical protein